MLGTDEKVLGRPAKKQNLIVVQQNCEKSAVKNSIEKLIIINLLDLDLSTMFCPSYFWTNF